MEINSCLGLADDYCDGRCCFWASLKCEDPSEEIRKVARAGEAERMGIEY